MFLPILLLASAASALPELAVRASSATITIDTSKTYQTMDGFGFSEAFQRANLIVNLPAAKQATLVDLLFNTTTGAGFSILRTGVGSSPDSSSDHMNSILPKNPGGPSATPNYTWDGKDSGQLFVAKKAKSYGVSTFYANAWSAPGYMKTNNNENNGGYLCGVSGETCSSGDWKKAYADYLIQYMKFYANEGINFTHVGFLNEPQNAASYAGMLSSGTQAADFVKVLYAELQAANMGKIKIACCDSEGWNDQVGMTAQLKSAGVESMLGIITSHTYTSNFNGPIKTILPVWQTEYSDLNGGWTTSYGSGGSGDGQTWASYIHNAIVNANCSGYLYWVATQGGNTNEKLIQVTATDYTVSKRLWAMAQFARYIRPGALRVGVTGSPNGLSTSAFVNADGAAVYGGYLVVPTLNTGGTSQSVTLSLKGYNGTAVTAWITSQTQAMASWAATLGADGTVTATVPGRSFVTFVVSK
ncbi:hypothetical protein EG329_005599 [Mollisiaceae sp. DMI_Dod_QoI]|nr:hypothetical protein EG329_005599 [Helotiales sp. DMI_Dod_QoI]